LGGSSPQRQRRLEHATDVRSACQLSDHHFALRTAFTLVARLEALAPTTLTGEPG